METKTQKATTTSTARKTYVRPTLRCVGSFKDLTRTDSQTQYLQDIDTNAYGMS